MRSWSWLSKWRRGKAREVDGISIMDLVNFEFVVVRFNLEARAAEFLLSTRG